MEVTFNIVEHIGVLRQHSTGWTKELNKVSWNDSPAKYDIRDWSPDHQMMGRGITLSDEEMAKVVSLVTKVVSLAKGHLPQMAGEEDEIRNA